MFFKVPEGVQHFPEGGGGSNIFHGVSNCLFPIETHITCDFPGGGGGQDLLSPPLDPHLENMIMSKISDSKMENTIMSKISDSKMLMQN